MAKLRVLMVEDSEDAALLLEEELRSSGYDVEAERVETAEAMKAALERQPWDIILADYRLPRFSGPEALKLLHRTGLDIPCIIVTGTVGEEGAVALMRSGASDLILKDNLTRLVPAVERELRDAEVRRRRRQAERELEDAQQRLLEAEIERRRFYREMLRAVTQDKFLLVDAEEIPTEGECRLQMAMEGAESYASLRHHIQEIAEAAGMPRERAMDLVLAAGEAATNAVKHASQGCCTVSTTSDRVIVRVSDHGAGIRPESIPAMISHTGFSTKASLGMGYTIMLQLTDRVWLATGPQGTVVQIEKLLQPEPESEIFLPATWGRL